MRNKKQLIIKLLVAIFCLSCCVLLCSCNEEEPSAVQRNYVVTLQESVFFTPSVSTEKVEKGKPFSTVLVYEHGYTYEGCNIEEAIVTKTEEGILLSVPEVTSDMKLIVRSKREFEQPIFPQKTFKITYHANGGVVDGGSQSYEDILNISYQFRANTSLGKNLKRDGYTLYGWNTHPDGSGEHIGLGSRTNASELYAEWAKWIPNNELYYRNIGNKATLSGYRGDGEGEMFVIPARIDGFEVTEIDSSFTCNMRCKTIESKCLILPNTIQTIKAKAFENAKFDEIYFFDNLKEVEEGAFSENIKTYHINTFLPPAFQVENNNARFADKFDYLQLQEGNRMVLFGGCSVSYGIDSQMMQEAFPDYNICNMGVIGGVNAKFQMEILSTFLHEGDMFVHLPEQMSPFQLMEQWEFDYRIFIMTEGNYDLLALADLSYADTFWQEFKKYQEIKAEQPIIPFSPDKQTYNIKGDIIIERPYEEKDEWERDVSYSDNSYQFNLDYLTEKGIGQLCDFYKQFEERGIRVEIGYAPINVDGIKDVNDADKFQQKFTDLLGKHGFCPMGEINDHLWKGRFFFDSDYHLNEFGAFLQTKQIIEELKEKL